MLLLKEKNKIAQDLGFENFAEIKIYLSSNSQFSQLISADDIINVIRFLNTIKRLNVKRVL